MPHPSQVDIKPRSRDVTDGLEKAAARGMLRAVGMEDDGGNSAGHDPAGHGATMPGMVDQATMDKLQSLTGADFDWLWLTSMIDHHRGAIAMAQDEIAHGKNPDVIYLARSIIAAQQAEIDQMKKMLGG